MEAEYFSHENGIKSRANFQTFIDEIGLLRIKSRLANVDESYDLIAAVNLPSKHTVVRRLIEKEHNLN